MTKTLFDTIPRSYKDVKIDGDQIDVVTFLEASEGLLMVLGEFFLALDSKEILDKSHNIS